MARGDYLSYICKACGDLVFMPADKIKIVRETILEGLCIDCSDEIHSGIIKARSSFVGNRHPTVPRSEINYNGWEPN